MTDALDCYDIEPKRLLLHQDRGLSMTAISLLDTLAERKVVASLSRPQVSNDNAFSESQFKTVKYQLDYPGRLRDFTHASGWCRDYFESYTIQHDRSGLAGSKPERVFNGCHVAVAHKKQATLKKIYRKHSERFIAGEPKVPMPPETVAVNRAPIELQCTQEVVLTSRRSRQRRCQFDCNFERPFDLRLTPSGDYNACCKAKGSEVSVAAIELAH